MSGITRRTHIVRVPMDDSPDGTPPGQYIDIEVLDAIAFRIDNNKEVVLSMDVSKVKPYIVDNTDGGHGQTGSGSHSTRRSHMSRITNPNDKTQQLDIEVIDCWGARDQNNDEWILDMGKPGNVFDISDGSGANATRRAHDEYITSPSGKTKDQAGASNYLLSQRSDNISFRRVNNKEVILSCPSCDDPNSPNVNFGRAGTNVTPNGYDPNDDSADAVVPPTLKESGDPHVYVAKVQSASGFMTGDAKIAMGPFWWIRKIKKGKALLLVTVNTKRVVDDSSVAPPASTVTFPFQSSAVKLLDTGTPLVNKFVGQGAWYVYISPPTQNSVWTFTAPPQQQAVGRTLGYNSADEFLAALNDPNTTNLDGFQALGTSPLNHDGTSQPCPPFYPGQDNTPSYSDGALNGGAFTYMPGFFPGMTPQQEALAYQNNGIPTLFQLGDNGQRNGGWPAGLLTQPHAYQAVQVPSGAETTTSQSFLFEVDAPSNDPQLTILVGGWPAMNLGESGSITATIYTRPLKNPDGSTVKTLAQFNAAVQGHPPTSPGPFADDTIELASNANFGPVPNTLTIGAKPDPGTPPDWQYWELFSTQPNSTTLFHPSTGRSPDP